MIKTTPKAEFFRLRTPLFSKGRRDTALVRTEKMDVRMKCYAEGGENELHTHPGEDHIFVVLMGQARFYDEEGKTRDLGRNEGIMLPAGAYYRFNSCGDEPLVMLRVGADVIEVEHNRIGIDGRPLLGGSIENKRTEDPVEIPGAFYE